MPKSRLDFWQPKLSGNSERDQRNQTALQEAGWRVIVIWECETKHIDKLAALGMEIAHFAPNDERIP
jgi:DNA mismatch endonuclease (patch repair protein)